MSFKAFPAACEEEDTCEYAGTPADLSTALKENDHPVKGFPYDSLGHLIGSNYYHTDAIVYCAFYACDPRHHLPAYWVVFS